jgi:hypothetical protein
MIRSPQNVSVTPRFSLENYELYSSWSTTRFLVLLEDSDLEFMVLFRSSSIITALTSTSKQADLYLGYRLKLK